MTAKCEKFFLEINRRHTQLEEVGIHQTFREEIAREDFDSETNFKTFRASKLKKLYLGIAVMSEWYKRFLLRILMK